MRQEKQLTVFYYGRCPICAREINFYKGRRGAERVAWVDVSRLAGDEVLPSLPAIKQGVCIFLRYPDGTLVPGREALVGVWAVLPGFRLWGKVFEVITSTRSRDLGADLFEDLEDISVGQYSPRAAALRSSILRGVARLRSQASR